jgi:hypothetical protein
MSEELKLARCPFCGGEALHSKSDIAAELAHRDITIEQLQQKNKDLQKVVDTKNEFVKHLSRRSCHCQLNAKHVQDNFHLPSCMVGKALNNLNQEKDNE